MGDVFGGGGGGGGGGGDETNQTEKALPSPAQIAATRAAFNTASGTAGAAKNLPYFAQVASSPAYRQALQNTANTWGNWMGTAPMDLSEGMAPISQGPFGSVIDAGNVMNQQISQMDPATQYMISQWSGPGPITPGSPYAPTIYDPYVQQKPLLHQGTAAQGGVGTIGAGGVPTTTLPATVPQPGTGGTPLPGGGTGQPAPSPRPSGLGQSGAKTGQTLRLGNKIYKKNAQGKYVLWKTTPTTGSGSGGGSAKFGGMPIRI